jgi:hypothetical protein
MWLEFSATPHSLATPRYRNRSPHRDFLTKASDIQNTLKPSHQTYRHGATFIDRSCGSFALK